MMTSPSNDNDDKLKRGVEFIICPSCKMKSQRIGAEHGMDIYKCESNHLTRIKVGYPREQWDMDR